METELREILDKLDALNGQVELITARVKSFDDFKEDLALFSNDAFNEVIKFLSDIDFHYRSGDFLFLIKTFLTNVGNVTKMMGQIQSFTELLEDVTPLAKEVSNDLIEKLHALDQEGFLSTLGSMHDLVIKLGKSVTPQEVESMGEGMIRLIKIVSRLSKPEYLDKLERIADIVESGHLQKESSVSLMRILKKARRKEVLQNIGLTLDYMKEI